MQKIGDSDFHDKIIVIGGGPGWNVCCDRRSGNRQSGYSA